MNQYETIKQVLDKNCSETLRDDLKEHYRRHPKSDRYELRLDFFKKSVCEHFADPTRCWLCKHNDTLAYKLSDALEFELVTSK